MKSEDEAEGSLSSTSSGGLLGKFKKRSERERRIDRLMELREEYATRAATRTTAAVLIVVGSLLGVLTGFMLLANNPEDLLSSSLFDASDSVDISGYALHNDTGRGVEGVELVLLDAATGAQMNNTITDENGFYRFSQISVKRLKMTVAKEGFVTIERTFTPNQAGEDPLTMHVGSGLLEEFEEEEESILAGAVTVSILVAVFTILTAFVGIFAAHEARRGKRYRRTQYLAGLAICSRGFIIFGPILILMGMILLMMSKGQFADYAVDEKNRSAGADG